MVGVFTTWNSANAANPSSLQNLLLNTYQQPLSEMDSTQKPNRAKGKTSHTFAFTSAGSLPLLADWIAVPFIQLSMGLRDQERQRACCHEQTVHWTRGA